MIVQIPAIVDNNYFYSLDTQNIKSIDGQHEMSQSLFPLIRVHQLQSKIDVSFWRMQAFPIHQILQDLAKAGRLFREMNFTVNGWQIDRQRYIDLVAAFTGLPEHVVENEIDEVANIMESLESILAVQIPGDLETVFDHHYYSAAGLRVGYYPVGKSLAIKVPGNIPTICLYWLIPFAQKRPVFLVPPPEDPLTHLLVVEAIKKVNPDLSALIAFLPCKDNVFENLAQLADQVLVSESAKHDLTRPEVHDKTHYIHYGRSKLLLTDPMTAEHVAVICRRMMWNSGRTCTGLTAVIVQGDAHELSRRIALELKTVYQDETGRYPDVPAFSLEKAELINRMIDEFVSKGEAVDLTEEVRGTKRLVAQDNTGYLLPTVLWVTNPDSTIFGLELPFPFITVITASDEAAIIRHAKNTLILSAITQNEALIKRLSYESSILKVFSGNELERGYNILDPHEGYLADFLNQKKAVLY